MKDKNLRYLAKHFLEAAELCEVANISLDNLQFLIDNKVIPQPSYQIESTTKITSSLADAFDILETKRYFPKNTIDLIQKFDSEAATKQYIQSSFIEAFLANGHRHFGYGDLSSMDGEINLDKLDIAFQEEWQHFLAGIYGICTLSATGDQIADKEIIVKRFSAFYEKYQNTTLNTEQKTELLEINQIFNSVVNKFAPYQIENSSRGKLNSMLNQNGLGDLILETVEE